MFRMSGIKPENQPAKAMTAKEENLPQAGEKLTQGTQTREDVEKRIMQVEAQRKAFLQKNPDFDMNKELKNPQFVQYLWGNSLSLEDAYFLTHRNEILDMVRQEAMEEVLKRRSRITENGAGKNQPAIATKNPKDLSDKEIDSIIERARNGEKITF